MADDFYYPDSKSSRNQIEEELEKIHFQWVSLGPILIFSLIVLLVVGGFTYYFFYIKPLNEQGAKCLSVNDCDDGNACTTDKCSSFSGICYHSNKNCARGELCNDVGECELVIPQTEIVNTSPNQFPSNPINNSPVNNSPSTGGSTSGTIPPPPPLPS